jgi:hypothetical protein
MNLDHFQYVNMLINRKNCDNYLRTMEYYKKSVVSLVCLVGGKKKERKLKGKKASFGFGEGTGEKDSRFLLRCHRSLVSSQFRENNGCIRIVVNRLCGWAVDGGKSPTGTSYPPQRHQACSDV